MSGAVVLAFVIGTFAGALLVAAFVYLRRQGAEQAARKVAEELRSQNEQEMQQRYQVFRDAVVDVVGNASSQALRQNSQEFLQLAETRLGTQTKLGEKALDEKKNAIGTELSRINEQLGNVEQLVRALENDRVQKFGALSSALENATARTAKLQETTEQLHRALASTKARGRWGEWMAENILALVGLTEGVDYVRQRTIEESGTRPDFTFHLPKGLKVNMDVKFPFDRYWEFLNADGDDQRKAHAKAFLSDVRQRIKEVTSREYIDPKGGTVDYVLVFVPNEQVFAFIQEQDQALATEALQNKVILCSPFSLYALLSVIHEAVSVFALEQRSEEILKLLAEIKKQWENYKQSMESMGKKLEAATREYDHLVKTRTNQLDRPFGKVELLKAERGAGASEETPAIDVSPEEV